MMLRLIARLSFVMLLCSCGASPAVPAFDVPREDGPGYCMEREAFRRFAADIASAEPEDAEFLVGRAISIADSISVALEDPWTVEELSHMLAGAFFDTSSPYCSDDIYSLVLGHMESCVSLSSWHRRMLDFRRGIMDRGRPGSVFPVDLPLGTPVLVFLMADECDACRKIREELAESDKIREAVREGKLLLEILDAADSTDGAYGLDPRFIPSLYLLDAGGIVMLKAVPDVGTLLRSREFREAVNHS